LHFSDQTKETHYVLQEGEKPKFAKLEDLFRVAEGHYISIDCKDPYD